MTPPNHNDRMARLGAIVELLAGEVTNLVLTRSIEMIDERVGVAVANSPLGLRARSFAAPSAPTPAPVAPPAPAREPVRTIPRSPPPSPRPAAPAKKPAKKPTKPPVKAKPAKATKTRQRLPRHSKRYTKAELKTIIVPLMTRHPSWGPHQLAKEADLPKTSVRDLYNELKRGVAPTRTSSPPPAPTNRGAEALDQEISAQMQKLGGDPANAY